MPATYLNGFSGHITFGGKTLEVVSWEMSSESGLIDVTNTGSSNWGQFIAGMNQGTVAIKAFWDTSDVPTATFTPGATGAMILSIGNSGKTITCSGIIQKFQVLNSPKEGVSIAIDAKITSAPVFPS